MGLRQRQWATKQRIRILATLGGKCTDCGTRQHLELDCIEPRGHKHHSAEQSWRISFFRKQMREGNLAIRCRRCHAIKTARQTAAMFPLQPPRSITDQGSLDSITVLRVVNSVNNYVTPFLDGGTAGGNCE